MYVKKVWYLIFCFFLGGLGIHMFYAGKVGKGLIRLIFCWTGIPVILAVFDFISGCLKSPDVHGNIIV